VKCFIISPIGPPSSDVRQHADAVLECIIKPALDKANISGRRADEITEVGRITRQMYAEILGSDFCIAVLHAFNPNVFYGLAVAHSAGVPVILMSAKGVELPFDMKDERVFQYDLDPVSIFHGGYISGALAMIEGVQRLRGKREVPFGDNLSPLGGTATDMPYSLRSETNASADYWLRLVRGTKTRLCIAGIGFTGWRGIPGMRDALKKAAASNCEIRVLTMDRTNPAFANMLNPEVTANPKGPSVAEARSWFQRALDHAPKAEVRALRKGMLFQQLIICDDKALVSPYLYSATTGFSPCLEIGTNCPVFEVYLREFDELWKANAET
jgi:hypothetical protein